MGIARKLTASITERDFPEQPPAKDWIRYSSNSQATLITYKLAQRCLAALLANNHMPRARLYGGCKNRQAILRKICAFRMNHANLDLWDVVRFRIVTADLHSMVEVCQHLLRKFKKTVVRCRNYYSRPRNGADDPYRAIHFELQTDDGWFVEIQVMTAMRESIGIIDHFLVHEKAAPYISDMHERWLLELSQAANSVDCLSEGSETQMFGFEAKGIMNNQLQRQWRHRLNSGWANNRPKSLQSASIQR
jgi:ppGpp synthetase/RelA/SpoT-type nucleotidyltranferase